jgi:AraC-like DNA-binding protein
MDNNSPLGTTRTQKIRADRYTTRGLPPEQQFSSLQQLVAPLMDLERDGTVENQFSCNARGFDLGNMHFLSYRVDPIRYRRDRKHIAASGIDHWALSVLKTGNNVSQTGSRVIHSSAGAVQVKSLANPYDGRCTTNTAVTLLLARDNFQTISDALDAADHVNISGPMGDILKECILALERHIKHMRVGEIFTVEKMLSSLIEAVLRPSSDNLSAARTPIVAAQFNLARRFIQENLTSPDLNPTTLCKALGVSRRQLYYLFEQRGGVAKFILRRRLAACCAAIADQSDSRLISTIAYSFGFTDAALFSRQFHAEYGFRPSEARAAGLSGKLPLSSAPSTFAEWLLQVRKI